MKNVWVEELGEEVDVRVRKDRHLNGSKIQEGISGFKFKIVDHLWSKFSRLFNKVRLQMTNDSMEYNKVLGKINITLQLTFAKLQDTQWQWNHYCTLCKKNSLLTSVCLYF